jgi:hypothetical protein
MVVSLCGPVNGQTQKAVDMEWGQCMGKYMVILLKGLTVGGSRMEFRAWMRD